MASKDVIFWDVDTQVDFMLPGGKLYVPGAEKLIPNLERLVDAARDGRVFLAGDADVHSPDDEEFRRWPPHCLRATPGAALIPETLTDDLVRIQNRPEEKVPEDLWKHKQAILEKQTLDVFDNPHTEAVVRQLTEGETRKPEFVVFGVVTEYCVRLAAKGLLERGQRVALVTDAIETLKKEDGQRTLEELKRMGARLITTEEALRMVERNVAKTV